VADIARRTAAAQRDTTWRFTVRDGLGRIVHHDVTRRRPSKTVAGRVVARDRTCRAPGCRAPASRTDLDHTHDYASGGPTVAANLGALCRHDHRLKHQGGWQLDQPIEGVFGWTTALGHTYLVGPESRAP
jgi:hypothetical protein